jgi:hypothetical protein
MLGGLGNVCPLTDIVSETLRGYSVTYYGPIFGFNLLWGR